MVGSRTASHATGGKRREIRRVRDVRFGPNEVTLTRAADGALYVRSIYPLGNYPDKLTERLDYWAEHTPQRVFLGQRDSNGEWRTKTYAETRVGARNIAEALLQRD